MATISGLRPCLAVEDRWSDVTPAIVQGRVSLVADRNGSRAPCTVRGWSTPNRAGARWVVSQSAARFPSRHLRTAGRRPFNRLLTEARSNGLPADHPILGAPFVARLRLHRTPRAPLALAVVLGRVFTQASRTDLAHDRNPLSLCDAPGSRSPRSVPAQGLRVRLP